MAITTKSFGVALIAGLLATSSVLSVPATAFAASNTTRSPKKAEPVIIVPTEPTNPIETNEPVDPTTVPESVSETANVAARSQEPTAPDQTVSTKTTDPAGNNGTIKIDRVPFDSHPDNQPHVTCSFQVDFYGFDRGVGNATVGFELMPPTKEGRTLTVVTGDLTPNIGEDAAGGGTDVDTQETYTLKFTGAPHDKQGYHVKVTVNAPGSQGADTKYKVFWVQPCDDENGQVLSTTTTEGGKGGILPTNLPSTGASVWMTTIATLVVAAASYVATLYRSQLRKLI